MREEEKREREKRQAPAAFPPPAPTLGREKGDCPSSLARAVFRIESSPRA
jgi:hypothetical protein